MLLSLEDNRAKCHPALQAAQVTCDILQQIETGKSASARRAESYKEV